MKVKTPCFVHVKDETKFNDLVEWVRQLNMMYWCSHESGIVCVGNDRLFALNGFRVGFDCGENIELFKALAAMNDKNDREQWFVVEHTGNADEIVLANSEDALAYIQSGDGYRKTTAAEIIEHFKNKRT